MPPSSPRPAWLATHRRRPGLGPLVAALALLGGLAGLAGQQQQQAQVQEQPSVQQFIECRPTFADLDHNHHHHNYARNNNSHQQQLQQTTGQDPNSSSDSQEQELAAQDQGGSFGSLSSQAQSSQNSVILVKGSRQDRQQQQQQRGQRAPAGQLLFRDVCSLWRQRLRVPANETANSEPVSLWVFDAARWALVSKHLTYHPQQYHELDENLVARLWSYPLGPATGELDCELQVSIYMTINGRFEVSLWHLSEAAGANATSAKTREAKHVEMIGEFKTGKLHSRQNANTLAETDNWQRHRFAIKRELIAANRYVIQLNAMPVIISGDMLVESPSRLNGIALANISLSRGCLSPADLEELELRERTPRGRHSWPPSGSTSLVDLVARRPLYSLALLALVGVVCLACCLVRVHDERPESPKLLLGAHTDMSSTGHLDGGHQSARKRPESLGHYLCCWLVSWAPPSACASWSRRRVYALGDEASRAQLRHRTSSTGAGPADGAACRRNTKVLDRRHKIEQSMRKCIYPLNSLSLSMFEDVELNENPQYLGRMGMQHLHLHHHHHHYLNGQPDGLSGAGGGGSGLSAGDLIGLGAHQRPAKHPLEAFEIDRKRLTLTRLLGKGAFGQVYQGYLICDSSSEHNRHHNQSSQQQRSHHQFGFSWPSLQLGTSGDHDGADDDDDNSSECTSDDRDDNSCSNYLVSGATTANNTLTATSFATSGATTGANTPGLDEMGRLRPSKRQLRRLEFASSREPDDESSLLDSHSIPVAVKTLTENGHGQVGRLDFLVEATNMSVVSHRNIVEFIGVCYEDEPHYIVMEFMAGGNLKHFLVANRRLWRAPDATSPVDRRPREDLCMGDLLVFALDVARACDYLQRRKIVHRDLAARNCLLSAAHKYANHYNQANGGSFSFQKPPPSGNPKRSKRLNLNRVHLNGFQNSGIVAKLADFGMTRDIHQQDYYRTTRKEVPVRWLPPESLVGVATIKSDVWSYGVLLWEVLSMGQLPYSELLDNNQVYRSISARRLAIMRSNPNQSGNQDPSSPNAAESGQLEVQASAGEATPTSSNNAPGSIELPPPLPMPHSRTPADLYALMCSCWATQPNDRPDFGHIAHRLCEMLDSPEVLAAPVPVFGDSTLSAKPLPLDAEGCVIGPACKSPRGSKLNHLAQQQQQFAQAQPPTQPSTPSNCLDQTQTTQIVWFPSEFI